MQSRFSVTGMMCAACVSHVEKAVMKLPGVSEVNVSLMTSSMTVMHSPDVTSVKDIIKAVKKAGYKASPASESAGELGEKNSGRMKRRLILSVIFTVLLMTVSMGHMAGLPLPEVIDPHKGGAVGFILIQLALTLPVLILNKKYFLGGFYALFRLTPNMESLIATGSGAAFIYGLYALVKVIVLTASGDTEGVLGYSENLYFESAAMILTLVLVGKTLEAFARTKTVSALEKLINLRPSEATLLVTDENGNAETRIIKTSDISVGDVLSVKSGESVPADGVIIKGSASLDRSALTGESLPEYLTVGDEVTGGTVSVDGYFEMKVTKTGEESALSEIIRLVSGAAASKAPVARLADKVSGVFVPIVILLSLVTFSVWMLTGSAFDFAFNCAVSVLVISCPCALGLATPVAVTVACGRSAERGVLIKNAQSLEAVGNVKTFFIDKTGTLTSGKLRTEEIIPASGRDETELLALSASLEALSSHPIALCVTEYAKEKGVTLLPVSDFSILPGEGLSGTVDEKTLLIGNEKLMIKAGVSKDVLPKGEVRQIPLYAALDGKYLGAILISDTVKEDSARAAKELSSLGAEVVMLTGDREETAKAVAEKLGISSYKAELLPADKEKAVSGFDRKDGKALCAMVGDGINDAPALSAADVGIAIGAGTEIAIDCADIVLTGNSLLGVAYVVRTSRNTLRTIKINLFWALFYNCLAIPLAAGAFYPAAGILLSPMIAAACMSFSSLFVVLNSLFRK